MLINESFLDQAIKNQYRTAKDMTVAVILDFILAIAIFCFSSSIIKDNELAPLLSSSVLGCLGFVPGKEILDRREKARNLEAMRPLLRKIQQNDLVIDPTEIQRVKEVFFKLIDKAGAD